MREVGNAHQGTYRVKSPVLLRIFRRPHTTRLVLDALREVKVSSLYVSADGPREGVVGEAQKVDETRRLIDSIDWECEVHTRFSDSNEGGPQNGFNSISWFFENEESGIILEDDCLPVRDFFRFCDEMLERYRNDPQVMCITGNNFQKGVQRGKGSYYFSKYNHVWGWASWRNCWLNTDLDLVFWPVLKASTSWKNFFPDDVERKYWENIFEQQYLKKIRHWDYAWTAALWNNQGMTVTPNVNLVTNIGFGQDALNCHDESSDAAFLPVGEIGHTIYHPALKSVDQLADRFVFDKHFGGFKKRFPSVIFYMPKSFLGSIYRRFYKLLNGLITIR